MSEEIYKIKQDFPWGIIRGNSNRSITFNVEGKERLRITEEGFYVEGRLAANDTEIYEAFMGFLNQARKPETQDDRYYKAIRNHIEKEKSNDNEEE